MLTVKAMSERYGIPRQTLYSAIHNGRLPATRSGATWLIENDDAREYVRWWRKGKGLVEVSDETYAKTN